MNRPLLLTLLLCATPAFAATPSKEFGSDWDDPRTATPPVQRPSTKACNVDIVDHGFINFDPYKNTITPPRDCPGPWAKIVLDMDGSVKGRQYDRISHIEIAGVSVLRTSTPEPSRDGISWHIEKDISAYASLFSGIQPLEMHLGNVVNETYTGVFQIKAHITFYQADAQHPAIAAADSIAPLQDAKRDAADLIGNFTLPANAQRLVAEVYATGSGGGCEEFWYFAAPQKAAPEKAASEKDYSCSSEHGPYREVQVLVDGELAGIALPYPHIYTGGWSNPFLWYVIPAPRAFDIRPIRYDLTPFIGKLNDGKPHQLRVHVFGIGKESRGWSLMPNVQVWRDARSKSTRGALLESRASELSLQHPATTGADGGTVVDATGKRSLKLRGWLQTSRGRVETTVEHVLDNHNVHTWDKGEDNDHLKVEWANTATVSVREGKRAPVVTIDAQRFGLDGSIGAVKIGDNPRITTTLKIHDDADHRVSQKDQSLGTIETRDSFDGSASFTTKVPREQRNAVGHSRQRYQRSGDGGCYDRSIAQQNGTVVEDRNGCP